MRTYRTVSEAVVGLKKRGYSIDFNLGFDRVTMGKPLFSLASDKFEITEVYRFEGETNPDDEAVVYAIESRDGIKGILVNGYGVSTNAVSDEMIKQLSFRRGAS
jgi:hypothetical protein